MSLPEERTGLYPDLNEREKKAAKSALVMFKALVDFDLTGLENAVEKAREGMRLRGWSNPNDTFTVEADVARAVRLARKEIGQ